MKRDWRYLCPLISWTRAWAEGPVDGEPASGVYIMATSFKPLWVEGNIFYQNFIFNKLRKVHKLGKKDENHNM